MIGSVISLIKCIPVVMVVIGVIMTGKTLQGDVPGLMAPNLVIALVVAATGLVILRGQRRR